MPNLLVFRPCDTVETVECWQLALEARDQPSVLALTRQNLPQLRLGHDENNKCAAGAYEIVPADGPVAMVSIFATGSEVAIAVEARKFLREKGVRGPRRLGAVLRAVPGRAGTGAQRGDRRCAGPGRESRQRCARAGTPSSAPTAPSSA